MEDRPAGLEQLKEEASGCTRCRLAETRTQVVFGVGNPDADLMFVGEAPGFHGQEQEVTLGGRRVALYPLYHPAAALYTPRMLEVLEEDFLRIPELIGRALAEPAPALEAEAILATATTEPAVQLGLF